MDQFENELVATLRQITAPDTTAIQQASQALQSTSYKNPLIIPSLINILQRNPETQVRQLAGVEARKLVSRDWLNSEMISDESKSQIKSTLLALLSLSRML